MRDRKFLLSRTAASAQDASIEGAIYLLGCQIVAQTSQSPVSGESDGRGAFLPATDHKTLLTIVSKLIGSINTSAFVDTNPTGYEPRYVNRWP
jgi:hypothetical protein